MRASVPDFVRKFVQDTQQRSVYPLKFPAIMQFYKPLDLQKAKVYMVLEIRGRIAQLVEQLTLDQRVTSFVSVY